MRGVGTGGRGLPYHSRDVGEWVAALNALLTVETTKLGGNKVRFMECRCEESHGEFGRAGSKVFCWFFTR